MVGLDAVTECLSRAAESRVKDNSCSNTVLYCPGHGVGGTTPIHPPLCITSDWY